MASRSDTNMAELEQRLGLVTVNSQLSRQETARQGAKATRALDYSRGIRLFGKDMSSRIVLGAVAAMVLLFMSPWHFRIALIGVAVCVFHSVLTELLFAKADRKKSLETDGETRGGRTCRHWLRWLFLLAICEGIPLLLVCLFLWLILM